MERNYCEYTPLYIHLEREMDGVLYTPKDGYAKTGIVVIHSDSDYLNSPAGSNMAKRGFLTLCANVEHPSDPLERKLPDVKKAVEWLKNQPGIEKIVLFGHSGGATLMTCYEAVAENGASVFRDDHKIVKMGNVEPLPAADGILIIDSNFGNGVMTLISIDPAVLDEKNGTKLNPEYDPFGPDTGWQESGETAFTEAFKQKFFAAQANRQKRLIGHALGRLNALESHQGGFVDDEPLLVPGGSQIAPNNKLFPVDLHMLAHTKGAYDLIHADGSVTHEVIPSVRAARGKINPTPILGLGLLNTTVKTYLSSNCVRTEANYGVREDGIEGIDYDSAFCCPPGNVKHIHIPMLIMGMTGGYECIASEIIYRNAASDDKTIAFVEGGTHMLGTAKEAEKYPGQFGDAAKTLFDAIADWLNRKF